MRVQRFIGRSKLPRTINLNGTQSYRTSGFQTGQPMMTYLATGLRIAITAINHLFSTKSGFGQQ